MAHPYSLLRSRCLWLLSCLLATGWQVTHAQDKPAAGTSLAYPYYPCKAGSALVGSIGGADELTGNNIFYLTQTSNLAGPVKWTATPAALFTSAGVSNSTTFITGPAACATGPAIITATVHVAGCPDSIVLQKAITVNGRNAPVVQGTYYCTTCSDRSVKTLPVDGSTTTVAYYGTYRIDLTSNSAQDAFVSWETFEAAGATLRIVSGTANRSGLVDIRPGASVAALAANVTNGCQARRASFRLAALNAQYARTAASPNPVSDELQIRELAPGADLASSQPGATDLPATCDARLYNSLGREVLRGTGPVGQLRLDVHTLPAGFYILRTTAGTSTLSERIQVAR